MEKRLKLSQMLHEVSGLDNVYFNPPAGFKMKFPCIVYGFTQYRTRYADNKPYKLGRQFSFTYIDSDPDSDMPDKLALMPQVVSERSYISDNLYHYPFRITL